MSNSIATSVSLITDDNIDNISDTRVVCLDIEQGFIGVHKFDPQVHVDVSGTIRCTRLLVNEATISASGKVDFLNIDKNVIPINNTYDLGSTSKFWNNAYITNISATTISITRNINISENINVSGNLVPVNNNVSNLGSSTSL